MASENDVEAARDHSATRFGGYAFLEIGHAALAQNDTVASAELFSEGLEFYRECADDRGVALAMDHLVGVALHMGDISKARDQALEALEIRRRRSHREGIVVSLLNMASIARLRTEPGEREAAVYERDAQRYAAEYLWVMALCEPFPRLLPESGLMPH